MRYIEFHRSRASLSDELREDHPVTDENIDALWRIIEKKNRTTYDAIQASLGIGRNQVKKIPQDHLGYTKVCVNLTSSEKRARVERSEEMLKTSEQVRSNYACGIVDETQSYC